ncbi:MAG: FMN-binding protein [Tissierellia bacterium]|nr:FMN-binding protein [Tissierellia bacterium]
MMKRVLALTLALLLMAVVFTGCSSSNNEAPVDESKSPSDSTPVTAEGDLVDGIYLIKRPVSQNGNFPMAKLEVKDGEIVSLNYNEYLATSGEAKNDSNYPYADGIKVIANLNEQFNEKKDLNAVDYDAVSGATSTKGHFKEIVQELLDKAAKGETYEPVYKDGVYEAKAAEPSHGWLAQVSIRVQDGQIVGVDYAEVAVEEMDGVKVGDRKSTDNYSYPRPLEVAAELQKLIIDNNGTDDLAVDAIAGATSTRTGMIELVNEALSSAK